MTYTPPARPGVEAQLRTCSTRRSRLWVGGTYFRSREQGLAANNLSIEVLEHSPPTGSSPDGVCIVTNYNLSIEESVTGPATATTLRLMMRSNEVVKIEDLSTQPRARKYSISSKIAPDAPVVTDLGLFTFSTLFHIPSLLSVRLTPGTSVFTPAAEIVIAPRTRVYRLETTTVTDPDTGLPTTGWDITRLRAAINASDPWVEMPERSGPTDDGSGVLVPVPNPVDVQDEGRDAPFLTPFSEVRLSGGDGLPASPTNEVTGPTKALVHVNYGEAPNGEQTEVNVVYQWVGTSALDGAWEPY